MTPSPSPHPSSEPEYLSRGSLGMTWYGLVSAMFFIYIGASLAQAYGTVNALIGLVLTIVVYGVINRVLATYALKNHLTVAQFSRIVFGRTGSLLATFVFAATAIYYAVFEGSIIVFALHTQFGGPLPLWSAIVVAYSMPLVVGKARRFLDRINGWLMPIYWGGLIAAVIWAGLAHGFTNDWLTHSVPAIELSSGGPGWLATFGAYMGVWILMMYTMDFAALGRTADTEFHRRWTFGWLFYTLAFGANALIGIFLTFTIPGVAATETGVAGGLVSLMGVWGLIVIFVSQTRINTANYYLGLTNLQEFISRVFHVKLPPLVWALITAFVIYSLMLLPVVEYLLVALAWQGVLITGWVGVALAHIISDRQTETSYSTFPDGEDAPRVKIPGIVAWTVSAMVGLTIVQSGVPWGAGLGSLITPVLAAAIYLALRKTEEQRRPRGAGLSPAHADVPRTTP